MFTKIVAVLVVTVLVCGPFGRHPPAHWGRFWETDNKLCSAFQCIPLFSGCLFFS